MAPGQSLGGGSFNQIMGCNLRNVVLGAEADVPADHRVAAELNDGVLLDDSELLTVIAAGGLTIIAQILELETKKSNFIRLTLETCFSKVLKN